MTNAQKEAVEILDYWMNEFEDCRAYEEEASTENAEDARGEFNVHFEEAVGDLISIVVEATFPEDEDANDKNAAIAHMRKIIKALEVENTSDAHFLAQFLTYCMTSLAEDIELDYYNWFSSVADNLKRSAA